VKKLENTYDFYAKKADKIFDLLLEKKQLKLPANHVIPSAEELKGKKYCKFHNANNHNTNKCRIFCFHIQKAIEQEKIKFEPVKKLDIDKHPFPGVHMVEFQLSKGKTKVLSRLTLEKVGWLTPRFKYQLISMKKLRNNVISERANMNKVRHPKLVLCVLV
jgi:hypothetical protein